VSYSTSVDFVAPAGPHVRAEAGAATAADATVLVEAVSRLDDAVGATYPLDTLGCVERGRAGARSVVLECPISEGV
jgi:hypothetical protein